MTHALVRRSIVVSLLLAACGGGTTPPETDAPSPPPDAGTIDAPDLPPDAEIPPDDAEIPPPDAAPPDAVLPGCGNGVTEADEACDDGNLADGDGCSAGCAIEGSAVDLAVAGDSRLFAIDSTSTSVSGRCYDAAGAPLASFVIATVTDAEQVQVKTAGSGAAWVATWIARQVPGDYSTRTVHARSYDAACAPTSAAFATPQGPSGDYVYDTAVAADGSWVLLWQDPADYDTAHVTRYDPSGSATGTLVIDDTGLCRGNYGIHVALSETTGAGIVTCQQHASDPIYYRRFDPSFAWIEASMVEIPETTGSNSSWYESHIVGMDDTGAFAIEWENSNRARYEVNFYDPSATLVANVVLGPTIGWMTFDAFRYMHQQVQVHDGGFLLRDDNVPAEVWHYGPDGALLGCASTSLPGSTIRSGGGPDLFAIDGGAIVKNPIDLTSFTGCARPTCGDGDLDFGELCDDGNRTPYDGCDEFCVPEGCGDAVVTGTETCDDGNLLGGDGCDASCALEPQVPPGDLVDLPDGIDDYDVAGDGSAVAVRVDGNLLHATCFAPDFTLRRASFPVSDPAAPASRPQVVVARDSRIAVVSWNASGVDGTYVHSRILDENCFFVGSILTWPGPVSDSLYDVAIDSAGNFTTLRRQIVLGSPTMYLSFYTADGTWYAELDVEASSVCPSGYGMRVALSRTLGRGVVTCQQHSSNPIYFRRFDVAGAWFDPAIVEIPQSVGNSSWSQSHAVAMNDAGEFVVEWQSYSNARVEAAFYDAAGTQVDHLVLGPIIPSWYAYEGFGRAHEKPAVRGSDFVLRDMQDELWLYDPLGALLGCDRAPYEAPSLRIDAALTTYLSTGSSLGRGVVDFDDWDGCPRPTCGNGALDPGELCDDGNRTWFDGCDGFCAPETCGDGIVTGIETCDDGNLAGGDGCDGSCQLEAAPPPGGSTLSHGWPVDDFDVAGDGSLIVVGRDNTDGLIYAECRAPDRTRRRARFPVSQPGEDARFPEVVVSRVSGIALVTWDGSGTRATLLDADCLPVRMGFTAIASGWEFHASAIDDAGNSVVIASGAPDGTARVAFFDATGTQVGSEQTISTGSSIYGVHAAMNQATGEGVITVQGHSGNVVSYRRFSSGGTWLDPSPVNVGVGYAFWYDGHAVGMNDVSQFAIEWRHSDGSMRARFYAADGTTLAGPLTFSTRMRASESGLYYDAFRRRHQEIPIVGSDFLLGEVYSFLTSGAERSAAYFRTTPMGVTVGMPYDTTYSMDSGMTARTDAAGDSVFRQGSTLFFGPSL